MGVIDSQYNRVVRLLGNVSNSFFYLGDILDQQYMERFNELFYSNLCKASTDCNTILGENKGLNVILLNYIDYVVSKYNVIKASSNYNLA